MARRPLPGGELEYAVLCALWELEVASARAIYSRVGEPEGLVYTTIARVLDRLHAKHLVAREPSGSAFLYRPTRTRNEVDRERAALSVRRLFGDAPLPAIAHLVGAVADVDATLLDELARQVNAQRRSRRGS